MEVHKAITDPSFSEDINGIGRIFLKFLAEIIDIETNIMRFIPVLIAPYLGKELIMRYHPPGILHQMKKQSVFSWT